jgi:cytochrome c-type biogenesis protein CcmH/NrfG
VKKMIAVIIVGLMLAGCQPSSPTGSSNSNNERQEAARRLFAQSIVLLQQKDLKGAVTSLEQSIKVDPSDPNPYLLLGQILLKANEFDNAVQFLDQTAKTFPNNGTVFYMLAIANRMDGKKLPAVLAARRSYEIFNAAGDAPNAQASAVLLQELITEAQAEEAAAKTADQGAAAPKK